MNYKNIFILMLCFFFLTCEDSENEVNTNQIGGLDGAEIIEGRTAYVVGSSYGRDGIYGACYWVNGIRYELPGGAWATDITVVDGTVYTSGTGQSSDACYWINQTRYDLPGAYGEAEAIDVYGDDIYVAGWYDSGSCYWKNGQRVDLTVNRDSQAFAIGVRDNGMVYIGGYYMNNHHYYIPCFWKDGNNRTNLPIPSGGDGEVNDIAFMDGGMRYYAGYVLHTSNFAGYTPKACYWRHTTRSDLRLGGDTYEVYGGYGNGITVHGDDIYVAGYTDWYEFTGEEETSGGTFAQYWKNNSIHDLEGGPVTAFGTGEAKDIKVIDGNVLVVGIATRDTSYENSRESACYWINGELHYLLKEGDVPGEIEYWYESEATGVFIE